MVREQGEQEGIGPERYYERQTESNRLEGKRSAGREKQKTEVEIEKRMSARRKTLQRDRKRGFNICLLEVQMSLFNSPGNTNVI